MKQLVVVPTTSEGIKTEVKIENKDEAKKDLRDSNIETINKTKGKVIFVLNICFCDIV